MTKLASSIAEHALAVASRIDANGNAELVRKTLVDAAAAAVAACRTDVFATAKRYASANYGAGKSSFWFSPEPDCSALGAAFANATAMSALDIDDGNRAARGHLGAAVIPVATAIGSQVNASARQFCGAVLAGCEIGARLGAAEAPAFSASGRWAGVGSAVAAGLLLDLPNEQLANAVAIAAHAAPLMAPAAQRNQMTGHIKEGVAFGALSGLSAALLAREGYTGDIDAIESCGLYDISRLRFDETEQLAFGRTYFKQYSCCRLAHASIDATLAILDRQALSPDAVKSISVETFRTAIELPNEARPSSFEAAQFSLPFTIALAALRGAGALLPMKQTSIDDQEVQSLAERITLQHFREFDQIYPQATPTRVAVEARDGRVFKEERDTAEGDPSRSFSIERLGDKFRALSNGLVLPSQVELIIQAISDGLPTARCYEQLLSGIFELDRSV